jgi:hypothetical protein
LKWVRGIFARQKNEERNVLLNNEETSVGAAQSLTENISAPVPQTAAKTNGASRNSDRPAVVDNSVAPEHDSADDLDEIAPELIEDAEHIGSEDAHHVVEQLSGDAEIQRRRDLVRLFFNDFWADSDDKPATFQARLDQAQGYINERLARRGESWRLDGDIRKTLALPPPL